MNKTSLSLASHSSNQSNERNAPIDFEGLVDNHINKPGRYIGQELGVSTRNWDKARVRWALTYPEIYEVGASNLGHIILYSILNKLPNQLCDRAYLPGVDLAKKLRDQSQPLFGVETRRPLFAFDILGFSLSYELGATNILEMLDLAQLKLYASERGDLPINDPAAPPLIFAGGPTATSNPEPYAEFFDFFALGDGEELLPEIGLVISEANQHSLSRSATLLDLSEIPGIYVPSLYLVDPQKTSFIPINPSINKKILRRVATPIPHYSTGLVPNIETIHDRLTIEIRRGCTRGCRFCQPGMLTRPARDVEPDQIINAVEKGMEKTGYSDFSLLSLSCSDYLALPAVGVELRNRLADKNVSLQLPSQRVDRFNDDIAHILGGSRKTGLTFAPEAGTQKLRDIVNKGLTDEDLINGIRKAMENGYRKVKLYFMIGLPGETDGDVIGISNTCKMLQEKCKDLGRLHLNITISNFTPKPHTPFQWHSVSTREFERKQRILRKEFNQLKGVKVNFTDVRLSAMEDFIGRGDRRLAKVIEKAWKDGAGMDAWFESLDRTYTAWTNAIKLSGLSSSYRKIEMGDWSSIESLSKKELLNFCNLPLPWDHIDTGIDKRWLANDLINALNAKTIPDCSFNSCSSCGVCGTELGHNIIIDPPEVPNQYIKQKPPTNKECRIRFYFTKTSPITLLSHLDIVRIFERALRRSNLPVSYSEGFHPLPKIKLALALPLGVEAYGEIMEIDFTQKLECKRIVETIQKTLPNGLNLTKAINVPLNTPSLAKQLDAAIWSFTLEHEEGAIANYFQWQQAVNSIMNADELIWIDNDKKGRKRTRDCRPGLNYLRLKSTCPKGQEELPLKTVQFEFKTIIDVMGRSLKPVQIKYWLEKDLKSNFIIKSSARDELLLCEC